MRILAAIVCLLPTCAVAEVVRPGAYDVAVSVQIPNVTVTNADFTARICWRGVAAAEVTLGPLGPGPLRACPGRAREAGDTLEIDTTCAGPNAGWATARYRATAEGFRGHVALNMGGKNMTVQEIQRGTYLGACPVP